MPLSFAGGADAFNVPDLLAGGLRTVTVCSDLLKTGGDPRLLQYPERVDAAFDAAGATGIDDFIRRRAIAGGLVTAGADAVECARANLREYASLVTTDRRYAKATFSTGHSKTTRALGAFDCIAAPCLDECPIDQQAPRYMRAVRDGDGRGRPDHPPRQPAAGDPGAGLRPPRAHVRPDAPRRAARDPPGEAVHRGRGGGGR